ncbi:hypothetical protein SEA_COMRADE_200 [Streptomyces phage Comrade]|uniref:Uncharacterized protein n=3 Tax=Gilsonvirus comrade TaxID=2846395 RepID=A0A345MEA1_9CAUD|nr:hypothetical protein HWB84_gp078 [Streptomyces phage Comrade]AXH68882.1 hypothetical protein SEA_SPARKLEGODDESS_203 [Streptomyces phage SparkleGoddess]QQO39856.1 hypothetical protein SEA_BELFORT_203 [Streptomyces phage Belfort]QZE11765.1 hypothetical protein SEA_KARP_199 [Streptomyces phage Karp]UTN92425.1 hypothetical protein SEA_STIGMA_201 [Streptomyces phage Stigma]AXQ63437.1 hypothetical protein SEA_COMRADE_200 [Streptomyces phage Comrade]
MSDRQPNFAVRDEVVYLGMLGIVRRVLLGKNIRYVVEFEHGRQTIPEGKLKRA